MSRLALAGISLLGLAASLGGKKGPRTHLRPDVTRDQTSFAPSGPSPRQRKLQKQRGIVESAIQKRHRHAFRINGQIVRTFGTFTDEKNRNLHTHFVNVPVGGRKTLQKRVFTTFDPFSPTHIHRVTIRGNVFDSGGPI